MGKINKKTKQCLIQKNDERDQAFHLRPASCFPFGFTLVDRTAHCLSRFQIKRAHKIANAKNSVLRHLRAVDFSGSNPIAFVSSNF